MISCQAHETTTCLVTSSPCPTVAIYNNRVPQKVCQHRVYLISGHETDKGTARAIDKGHDLTITAQCLLAVTDFPLEAPL